MYILENNIAWTDDLKNAFKTGTTYSNIICEGQTYTESDFLKEAELKDIKYVPNGGFIGQAISRMLTIKLVNDENSNLNFENKEMEFKIGAEYNNEIYYINYGNFIVNEPPENDATNGTIKFIAYDYMIKFNKPYVDRINYPCTLKALLEDICSQADVVLGSTTFRNQNFLVDGNQFGGKTLREVLQHIAKSAFSWARIGQDNKLYLDFEVKNTIDETITLDDYKMDAFKKANEYYGPINKVTYADSDIQGQEISVQDNNSIEQNGLKELIIYDNFFAYTTDKRQQLIQAGTALFGLRYIPIQNLELIGLIYLDCNDIIEIETEGQNSFISRNFTHIIKYNGAVADTIENAGESDNEQKYANPNNPITQNSRLEIIVDRAKKEILLIGQEVTAQNNKIAQINLTVDEINSKIEDIADITTYGESDRAVVSLENINESEPIEVRVHPTSANISYLYPRENLYPSDDLYITTRTLRFIRTYEEDGVTKTENIDYELPDDLLRYNNEVYDEFYLNYDSGTCQIIKRCVYNADGSASPLSNEIINNYPYPEILLGEGDYEISLLGYNYGYIYARLMAKNIYTTQFYTKVETNNLIEQKGTQITLSVEQRLTNYATKTELNAAKAEIKLTTDSITSSVNQKVGKNEVGTYIEQNTNSVKVAWNQISQYIQLMPINNNASLAILNDSSKVITYLDKNGQHFCNSNGNVFGEVGVQQEGNSNYIAFSVEGNYGSSIANGMAWGIKTTIDNKFHPIFYIKNFEMSNQQSDTSFGQLVLSSSDILLDGIGTGIITGGMKIFGDPTAGGMYFYDINADKYNMTISPENSRLDEYGSIDILDSIRFYRNQAGSNSFKVGNDNNYCLFTDEGHIYGNKLQITGEDSNFFGGIYCSQSITAAGDMYAQNFISDKRLKKNIKECKDNAIDIIDKIQIYSFNWKKNNEQVNYGFIAQELEKIDNNYVLKRKTEKDYQYYVNELPIVATLVKAVQELNAEIQELKGV